MATSLFPNNLQTYGTKCYISLIAPESSSAAIKRKREGCIETMVIANAQQSSWELSVHYANIMSLWGSAALWAVQLQQRTKVTQHCIINYNLFHWQHKSLLGCTGALPCSRTWQQCVASAIGLPRASWEISLCVDEVYWPAVLVNYRQVKLDNLLSIYTMCFIFRVTNSVTRVQVKCKYFICLF